MSAEKMSIGAAIDQVVDALKNFEGKDQGIILRAVYGHLNIEGGVRDAGAAPKAAQMPTERILPEKPIVEPERRSLPSDIDIKTLKDLKKPASARQMACLVGYYLQEHAPENERKSAISAVEIEKYFKQAGFKLPSALGQLFKDSKAAGYFESAGRGEYKLTRVGYNLVTHSMPTEKS